MARIVARVADIQKYAIDRNLKPTAHAIAHATGQNYETTRKMMLGETPSPAMMAAMMLFWGRTWDELFVLEGDNGENDTSRAAAR